MAITTILIVITVFSSLATIVLTLMQTSKGDMGSAFGGGGSQSMFGSRGSANFLSRSTSVMVTVFFLSSISLAYFYAQRDQSTSIVDASVMESVDSDVPVLDETNEGAALENDALESVVDESVPTLDAPAEGLDSVPSLDAAPTTEEAESLLEEGEAESDAVTDLLEAQSEPQ